MHSLRTYCTAFGEEQEHMLRTHATAASCWGWKRTIRPQSTDRGERALVKEQRSEQEVLTLHRPPSAGDGEGCPPQENLRNAAASKTLRFLVLPLPSRLSQRLSKKTFYVYFCILHAYTIIYLKYRVYCSVCLPISGLWRVGRNFVILDQPLLRSLGPTRV